MAETRKNDRDHLMGTPWRSIRRTLRAALRIVAEAFAQPRGPLVFWVPGFRPWRPVVVVRREEVPASRARQDPNHPRHLDEWTRPQLYRHGTLFLACLLFLATGLALLGLASTVADPGYGARPPTDTAALSVVTRFYDAANTVLRTGDVAALDAVLAPEFVDHDPAPGGTPDRAGLAELLRSRHVTFPGERLVVDHATVGGDEVAVRVHAEEARAGAFLGLPLPAEMGAWAPLEVFRVDGETIAERWGGGGTPLVAQPLWQLPCSTLPSESARSVLVVERPVYSPGDVRVLGDGSSIKVVFVETGTLTAVAEPAILRADGQPYMLPSPVARPSSSVLAPGDLVSIPTGTRLFTRSDGDRGAVVVTVAIAPATPVPSWAVSSIGPEVDVMAIPAAVLAGGRLTLAAGTKLDIPASPILAFAIVEAGTLEVATPGGAGGTAIWRTVLADDRVAVRVGERDSWRAGPGEPTVLLLVTVAPGSDGDGPLDLPIAVVAPSESAA